MISNVLKEPPATDISGVWYPPVWDYVRAHRLELQIFKKGTFRSTVSTRVTLTTVDGSWTRGNEGRFYFEVESVDEKLHFPNPLDSDDYPITASSSDLDIGEVYEFQCARTDCGDLILHLVGNEPPWSIFGRSFTEDYLQFSSISPAEIEAKRFRSDMKALKEIMEKERREVDERE